MKSKEIVISAREARIDPLCSEDRKSTIETLIDPNTPLTMQLQGIRPEAEAVLCNNLTTEVPVELDFFNRNDDNSIAAYLEYKLTQAANQTLMALLRSGDSFSVTVDLNEVLSLRHNVGINDKIKGKGTVTATIKPEGAMGEINVRINNINPEYGLDAVEALQTIKLDNIFGSGITSTVRGKIGAVGFFPLKQE